jgi:AcrR family transcriptional regulator
MTKSVTRSVGRPRTSPRLSTVDPREEILDVAARLFSTIGYGGTSTRQIAEGAGLRQASLFHYFARKEDILAVLLDRTLDPALSFLDQWIDRDVAGDIGLYVLMYRDTDNLCSGPYNIGKLNLLPEARAERFDPVWAKRKVLWQAYRDLLLKGIAQGRLAAANADVSTDLLFSLVEGTTIWFERGGALGSGQAARMVADGGIRMVLVDQHRLAEVAEEGRAILSEFAVGGQGHRAEVSLQAINAT